MTTSTRFLLLCAAAGVLAVGCGASVSSATLAPALPGSSPSSSPTGAAAVGADAPTASSGAATSSTAVVSGAAGPVGAGVGSSSISASASPHAAPAMVTKARVDGAAGTVDVDVTVSGPAEVLGGCQAPLTVHLLDAFGRTVSQPSPPGGVRCLAIVEIAVAAGRTQDFTATVPLPATHGLFTVRGDLRGVGPIPPATVQA